MSRRYEQTFDSVKPPGNAMNPRSVGVWVHERFLRTNELWRASTDR